jgi:hypothetical protein
LVWQIADGIPLQTVWMRREPLLAIAFRYTWIPLGGFAHFRPAAVGKQKSYYAVFRMGLTIGYEHLPSSEPRFAYWKSWSACGQS